MTRSNGSLRAVRPARLLSIFALIAVFVSASVIPAGGSTRHSSDTKLPPLTVRRSSDVELSSGVLRHAVGRMREGRKAGGRLHVSGNRILVEVLFDTSPRAARRLVRDAGGRITGAVGGSLLEASVPFDRLESLERSAGIVSIRPPLMANVVEGTQAARRAPASGKVQSLASLAGEEILKTNADDWHAAGHMGAGVKVGVIDYFDDTIWNASQAAGEVPAPAGTFCRVNGTNCNIWTGGSPHGTGVAEIIHEMAPAAQIYIVTVQTTADLQAGVTYLQGQGVKIITRSLTSAYDGPGDGTGPVANVINNAVASGITWFNSAGNSAGAGTRIGSYWRGNWSDPDGNGWLNFSGTDELMGFGCTFINGLRWSDWGAGKTDYDIYVYDDPGGTVELARSVDDQSMGAQPLENVNYQCKENDVDFLAVGLYNAGSSGTAGDVLEFMVNGAGVEYWSNPFSAAAPASDTKSAGALSIGAVDPAMGTAIAAYSSQGPTNDNRTKPDMSAAACVLSLAYAPECFNGTSAATPVAAGAGALVLGSGAATTPAALKTYLMQAVVDRGAPGADNVYGTGELLLPAPTGGGTDTTPPSITGVGDRPDPFTPTARKKKAAKIYWTTDEDVPYLFVGIYKGTKLVRTLYETDLAAGSWFLKWNGLTAGGRLAKKGTYSYLIYAEDLAGNGSEVTGTTTLVR